MDGGEVAHEDGRTANILHHDVANLANVVDESNTTHDVGLRTALDDVTADVDVAVGDGLIELERTDAVGGKLVGIDADLEGLHLTAETDDVGNAGHGAQLALDDPVLQRLQLAHRPLVAAQRVAVNLARRTGERLHVGFHAIGQVSVVDEVVYLLARELVVDMIFEADGDHGETKKRRRTDVGLLLHRIHSNLDGDGDELLYLLSRAAGPLRDDGHLGVGHVGEGVNGRLAEADHTEDDDGQRHHEDEILAAERESDDGIDEFIHYPTY